MTLVFKDPNALTSPSRFERRYELQVLPKRGTECEFLSDKPLYVYRRLGTMPRHQTAM